MQVKTIAFTAPQTAELVMQETKPLTEDSVCIRMEYTVISGGKGVNGIVEVTGNAKALQQALGCAAREGRISLLGCTRVSDCPIDFYQQVHLPGIKLIGAHNFVRPLYESRPHEWTHQDDCKTILALIGAGRIRVKPFISRVVKPADAPAVYTQLCNDPAFPMGTVFDWR